MKRKKVMNKFELRYHNLIMEKISNIDFLLEHSFHNSVPHARLIHNIAKIDEYIKEIKRVLRVKYIEDQVRHFFKLDKEKFDLWMNTPNHNLGGTSPQELIDKGREEKLYLFVKSQVEGY